MTPPFVFEKPGTRPASIGAEKSSISYAEDRSCHLAASMPRTVNQPKRHDRSLVLAGVIDFRIWRGRHLYG
jgi:hypothetical protein